MPVFLVTWEIHVEAPSPREAAEKAHRWVQAPDTTATVYSVIEHNKDGSAVVIDLMEDPDDHDS